jgi:hypothetical protein
MQVVEAIKFEKMPKAARNLKFGQVEKRARKSKASTELGLT